MYGRVTDRDLELCAWRARKRIDTGTLCSCSMCGNPRKHYKGWTRLTLQELKHDLDRPIDLSEGE
jgi:hypothetical protein